MDLKVDKIIPYITTMKKRRQGQIDTNLFTMVFIYPILWLCQARI